MEWDFGVSDTPSPQEQKSTEQNMDQGLVHRLRPFVCEECGGEESSEELLSCRGCGVVYHTFCLVPQLPSVPMGMWYCPCCIAKVRYMYMYMCIVYVCEVVHLLCICDPLYENHAYSAKNFFSYRYSHVEETFLFLKRPLV